LTVDTARVPERSRSESFSTRFYAGLLRAYPAEFRRRYAREMTVLFGDQLREARLPAGRAGVWLSSFADIAVSAIGEHLRRDRTVARSLATFTPTRSMRLAGIIAAVGGLLLLWAFFSWSPFDDRHVNSIRLILFWSAGIAIALAFHGRQAAVRPFLARTATGAIVLFGVWNVLWVLLAWDRSSPFSGDFGFVGFVASLLGWLAASFYGVATLAISAAWRGMGRWEAAVTRLAAALILIAGVVATLGMDRLGLTRSESYGELFATLGALGVGGVGLAWMALGLVLVMGGRRPDEAR
jgi:hypothetical protein